jgi:hypothetical protein
MLGEVVLKRLYGICRIACGEWLRSRRRLLVEDKLSSRVGIDVVVHVIADVQHHMWRSHEPKFKLLHSEEKRAPALLI